MRELQFSCRGESGVELMVSLEPSQRSVSYAFKILLIILDTRNEALGILTGDNEVVLQMRLLVILSLSQTRVGFLLRPI